MINLGEAYRELIEKTNKKRYEPHGQSYDEQMTNK